MTASGAMYLTMALAAVGTAIASIEYLTCPQLMADHALAGWPVSRTNRSWKVSVLFESLLGWLFRSPAFLGLVAVRLLAAVIVIVGGLGHLTLAAAVVAIASCFIALRSPYGTDGADQMIMVIFFAATGAGLVGSRIAVEFFLWFVTAQACLSYLTAGIAKASSRVWRDGRALPGILGTTCYGYPQLGPMLASRPRLSKALAFGVIAVECSFPAVLLGLRPLTLMLLALTFCFHFGALALMRLNTFFWAFLATYPSILFCVSRSR